MTVAPHVIAAQAANLGRKMLRADPLGARVFASPQQRDTWRYVAQEHETLFRAGNGASKTDLGAALSIALLQQRPSIDGRTRDEAYGEKPVPRWELPVPEIRLPVTGWCLVQSYKAALSSVVDMLKKYLGDWPHRWRKDGGYPTALEVMPWGGDPDAPDTWSRLVFFVEGGDLPSSGRVDFIWADEPPLEEYWSEMLQRARAGGVPFFAFITATPKDKRHWMYLRLRFQDCERRVNGGRVEVVSSMLDNQFLTARDRERRLERARGDKRALAILHGAYVDVSGTNPWPQHYATMDRLSESCTPPVERVVRVHGEQDSRGERTFTPVDLRVESWGEPEAGELYWALVDCSLGIQDEEGRHSPAEIMIVSRARPRGDELDELRRPKLVERWNGYATPYTVGSLLASMSARWNGALADVDATGGYGEAVILRARQLGCRFMRSKTLVKGEEIVFDGFRQTPQVVANLMASIGEWLERAGRGEAVTEVPSAAVIACLRNAQVNDAGKLMQGAGAHTEDITCLGRALWLLNRRPAPLIERPLAPTNRERLEQALGKPLRLPRRLRPGRPLMR